ncbi:uncharacterized protein LODBEIA_P58230 [Lodderomyces beijingensis]|uniref:PIN domain-containing protein n=1 Tax=Lodderomyces beijingensis TaxID=1775926 RepID=A0ABP0ZUM1_9ASCO
MSLRSKYASPYSIASASKQPGDRSKLSLPTPKSGDRNQNQNVLALGVDNGKNGEGDGDGDDMMMIEDEEVYEYMSNAAVSGSLPDNDRMVIEESPEFETIDGNITFLVVDTNFVLSHLDIVEDLKQLAVQFQLKIVIPYYVLVELDGLKERRRTVSGKDDVSALAVRANDWIHAALATSSPVVRAQSLSQRIDKDKVKDDAILDCCLYFREKYASLVVLLTNDKNLNNKALANELPTVKYEYKLSAGSIAETCLRENIHKFGVREKVEVARAQGYRIPSQQQQQQQQHQRNYSDNPAGTKPTKEWLEQALQVEENLTPREILSRLYLEIHNGLQPALHKCMQDEYKEELELVRDYDRDSFASLQACSLLIIRFWPQVFSQYFRTMRSKFVPFEERGERRNVKRKPVYTDLPTESNAQQFVNFWGATLSVIYRGVMDEGEQEALEAMIQRWNKMVAMI